MKTYYIYNDATLLRSWPLDYEQGMVVQFWGRHDGWINARSGSYAVIAILQNQEGGTPDQYLRVIDEFEAQKWQFVRKL